MDHQSSSLHGITDESGVGAARPSTERPPWEATAVGSVVLGVLGALGVPVVAPVGAIVLGHIARSRLSQAIAARRGAGLAMAGLALGYSVLVIQVLAIGLLLLFARGGTPSFGGSDASACNSEARTLQAAVRSAKEAGEGSRTEDFLTSPLQYFEPGGKRLLSTLDEVSEQSCPAVIP